MFGDIAGYEGNCRFYHSWINYLLVLCVLCEALRSSSCYIKSALNDCVSVSKWNKSVENIVWKRYLLVYTVQ